MPEISRKEAPVVNGKVEAIVLTGGIAYSELFTNMVKERVEFIAPVVIYGGENEMQSLALADFASFAVKKRPRPLSRWLNNIDKGNEKRHGRICKRNDWQ